MAQFQSAITGAAGEHYVMWQLLRRGHLAALTPTGAAGVDILISDQTGQRLAALQVKTAGSPVKRSWQMNQKHESIVSPSLFYCFVSPSVDPCRLPDCWIVPSEIVAEHVRLCHELWLSGTPRNEGSRIDSPRRAMNLYFENTYPRGWMDEFHEAWGRLEVGISALSPRAIAATS
jgi:hypothetical protein